MSGPSGFDRLQVNAEELHFGVGVDIHPTAIITGYKGKRARKVVLGDHCVIGEGCRIMVAEFELGDYSKLNANAYSYGRGRVTIGRNCWFGGGVVLDGQGALDIEDNCTIGADCKLWAHFLGGDWVRGGNFNDHGVLRLAHDTWLGCDCVVSKSTAPEAMFLAGTIVSFVSAQNRTYCGNPMIDITGSIGPQFSPLALEDRQRRLEALKREFLDERPEFTHADLDCFDAETNTYEKRNAPAEVAFIKAMMPRLRMLPREPR